jgi:hypothetical protein
MSLKSEENSGRLTKTAENSINVIFDGQGNENRRVKTFIFKIFRFENS